MEKLPVKKITREILHNFINWYMSVEPNNTQMKRSVDLYIDESTVFEIDEHLSEYRILKKIKRNNNE
jgi:hypothetical protein